MDLSEYISIPPEWEGDLDKPLNDKTIKRNYPDLKLNKSYGEEFDSFAVSLEFQTSGKFSVFNDEEDEDELLNIDPNNIQIYTNQQAMLRYDLLAQLKAAAGFSFKNLGFEFDADQSLRLSYYKIHDDSIKLKEAFLKDIKEFKVIYSAKHIKGLKANEALAVEFFGSINAELGISVSDAYSGSLSAINQFLPEGTGTLGEVEAGASLSFSIGIKDNFKAFIQKIAENEYKVVVNKSISNTKSASAKMEITAQLNDSDESAEALNLLYDKLHEAVLGNKVEKLDEIINSKLDNLSDQETDLVNLLISRLGWEIDITEKDIIQEKYEELKAKVIEKVAETLENKLELGLSFEYQRVDSSNTLFEASFTTKAVEIGLRNILMYNLGELVNVNGVTITKYLFETSKEITSKFGFAMQFGNFKSFWFNQNSYKEEVTINYLNNKSSIVFSPQRLHEHQFLNHKKWYINLVAQLNESQEIPRLNDFDFSFTLHWEDEEKKTKQDELYQFVDMGVIWNSIPEDEVDKTIEVLSKFALNKKKVKYDCHFHIPLGTFEKLMDKLANPDELTIVNSLSEAVPYQDFNFRKTPSLRKIAYNSIWQAYLDQEPTGFKQLANFCAQHLHSIDPELAEWEGSFSQNSTTTNSGFQSFVGLIEFNYLYKILKSFRIGVSYYDSAIDKNKGYSFKKMKKAFKRIDDLLHTSGTNKLYNLNFLARYLFNVASELGLTEEIESTSSAEYTDESGKQHLLYFSLSK